MTEPMTDELQFAHLIDQHEIKCRRTRSTYHFEDLGFTAHGFREAYGFAEGFDRGAKSLAEATRLLYNLTGLFITGDLKKQHSRPEVREAVAYFAAMARHNQDEPPIPIPSKLVDPGREVLLDLDDELDEALQPWTCPQCQRVFGPRRTTYISPIDGIERCEDCAGKLEPCRSPP
jgi:hypothetical protein